MKEIVPNNIGKHVFTDELTACIFVYLQSAIKLDFINNISFTNYGSPERKLRKEV